jgi:type IV secretory pathway VirB2 component (pilin)
MTETSAKVKHMKKQAEEVMDDVAASPWMERIARFGYATKGVVYIVVGGLATLAAVGLGGEATDVRGALSEIERKPFGKVALATVAFGLIGYVLWRWVQAIADADNKGTKLKGIALRIGYFFSGAVYAGLAYSAAKILFDVDEQDESSSETQENWIARVLGMPFGRTLVILAGGFVIGFGLYQIYKGLKAKFRKRLKLGKMGETKDTWATWSGRIGYAARGVVFCIIGFFVIQAALHFNPDEAKGLDEALQTLAQNYYGAWALGVVAVGLIVYGFYMLVEARYRRIAES